MKITCEKVLEDYIKTHEGWHKKVFLYAVAEDWSPETVGRKLRKLEKEEKIKRGTYDGVRKKGLVKYCYGNVEEYVIKLVPEFLPNGSVRMVETKVKI